MYRIASFGMFFVLLSQLLCACHSGESSIIVSKFQGAGGGDPSVADVAGMSLWLRQHGSLASELYGLCQPRFQNPPNGNWAMSDEGKVCQAAVNSIRVVQQPDKVPF